MCLFPFAKKCNGLQQEIFVCIKMNDIFCFENFRERQEHLQGREVKLPSFNQPYQVEI